MIPNTTYNLSCITEILGNLDSKLIREASRHDDLIFEDFSTLMKDDLELFNILNDKSSSIESVIGIVKRKVADESFDLRQFAKKMNVSTSTLQQKIDHLISTNPNMLVYSFRIEIARQLLLNNSLNIAEVAYRVGFNDPKYFSRQFKNEIGLTPKKYREKQLSASSFGTCYRDEPFLKKVSLKMEKRLSDENLSLDQFAKEMNMSKASLYRKLKSVSGLSPCEFIRSIRIKHSAQLLSKQKKVAEVAFEVGFNNSKYFSICFKSEFGVTPTQYVASKSCQ
jgi:AraC-like DNA-binding protein